MRRPFLKYFKNRWPNLRLIKILSLYLNVSYFSFLLWRDKCISYRHTLRFIPPTKESHSWCTWVVGLSLLGIQTTEESTFPRLNMRLDLELLWNNFDISSLNVLSYRANPRQFLIKIKHILSLGNASNLIFKLIPFDLIF